MFYDCVKLTTVPSLNVMDLADNCYGHMFAGCESLEEVPELLLPATTLTHGCY
jgi:hypothetical protein